MFLQIASVTHLYFFKIKGKPEPASFLDTFIGIKVIPVISVVGEGGREAL